MKVNKYISIQALKQSALPFFFCLMLLFSACSSEDEISPEPPINSVDENVILEVKIPGAKTPTTYGMTVAEEDKINEMTILAYQVLGDIEILSRKMEVPASGITNDGNGNVVIKLALTKGKYNRLVLIANANAQVASLNRGDELSKLEELEYQHATGKWNVSTPDYIPMSGEIIAGTSNGFVVEDGRSKVYKDIKLIRMLAKVDVQNKASDVFTLQKVMIYNMNRNGLIVADENYSATPLPIPNLPASLQKIASPIAYDFTALNVSNEMNGEIYLFESTAAVEDQIVTSPRIIVEGIYEGEKTYYPIDFAYSAYMGPGSNANRGTLMPIIRNYHYVFMIERVYGPGFGTAEEALNYPGSFTNGIAYKILEYDREFTDIYYNSSGILAVNTTDVELVLGAKLYEETYQENSFKVYTNEKYFYIDCYNVDGTPADWLEASATRYNGAGSVRDVFLKSNLPLTYSSEEKEGYIIIRAGGLRSDKIPVYKKWCGKNGIALNQAIHKNITSDKGILIYHRQPYLTHAYPTGSSGIMQCWMVQNSNMAYEHFVPQHYGDDLTKVNGVYPKYDSYIFESCGDGWRLPTLEEWTKLSTAIQTDPNNTGRWFIGPTSQYEVNKSYAGILDIRVGVPTWGATDWGLAGYWWTSTANRVAKGKPGALTIPSESYENYRVSVRCVKDE